MSTPLARIAGAILALFIMGSLAGAAGAAPPQAPGSPAGPQPARPETHDRLGQIVWETVSGNTVHPEATAGIRRSYYTPQPNVGDSVPFSFISFGDGFQSINSNFVVTFVDAIHDWIIAE